jgi:DNA-binding protein HU-beta
MNKAEFISSIADKTGFTKKDIATVYTAIEATIYETLAKGDKITLTGFGTFKVSERGERVCRNPQTGESMTVKARKVPAFKAGKEFKANV